MQVRVALPAADPPANPIALLSSSRLCSRARLSTAQDCIGRQCAYVVVRAWCPSALAESASDCARATDIATDTFPGTPDRCADGSAAIISKVDCCRKQIDSRRF